MRFLISTLLILLTVLQTSITGISQFVDLSSISSLPLRLASLGPTVLSSIPRSNLLPGLINSLPNALEALREQNERFTPTLRSGVLTLDIIRERGFIGEHYKIRSKDGCPLSVYHIINPLADPSRLNKYPVAIFHGLAADSSQMISHSVEVRPRKPELGQININPTDESLAFLLSNNNYDVWLLDARGVNVNSRDPKQPHSFWDYSLDEQALLDLPSMIDFILQQTGTSKVVYIGYSESTLFMFALLSWQPEYQDKLAAFVALAPVAYVGSAMSVAIAALSPISLIPDQINGNYIPQPLIDSVQSSISKFCSYKSYTSNLCNRLSQITTGLSESTDIAPDFYATQAKSTSVKAFKHFFQLRNQKRFGMYDYGPEQNMIRYGQSFPPKYHLANIRLPTIILIRAGNDLLSNPNDQQLLKEQLGVSLYLDLYIPEYNHVDFIIGKDVVTKINEPALRAIHKITSSDGMMPLVRQLFMPVANMQRPIETSSPSEVNRNSVQRSTVQSPPTSLLDALILKPRLGALPSISGSLNFPVSGDDILTSIMAPGYINTGQ